MKQKEQNKEEQEESILYEGILFLRQGDSWLCTHCWEEFSKPELAPCHEETEWKGGTL